jgi:hypothetical protein
MSGSAITSETANRAAGTQHTRRLADDPRLVAGHVDHAVGDDRVDGLVVQRHVLEVGPTRRTEIRTSAPSGCTTGSQHGSPAGRLVFGVSSRPTTINKQTTIGSIFVSQ